MASIPVPAKPGFLDAVKAKAKSIFSRGKTAAEPLLPCGASAPPPPIPDRPCDLARVDMKVGIKSRYKVHTNIALSNAKTVASKGRPVLQRGQKLSSDQLALLDSYAVVVDMLSPFAAPGKEPSQTNQLADHNKLESVSLKGQVEFIYDSSCGDLRHPRLEAQSNYDGKTVGDFARRKASQDAKRKEEQDRRKALKDEDKQMRARLGAYYPYMRKLRDQELEEERKQREADEKDDPTLPPGTDTFQPLEMEVKAASFDWEWFKDRWRFPSRWIDTASTAREVVVDGLSCGYPAACGATGKPHLRAYVRFGAVSDIALDVQFIRGITWSGSRSKKLEGASLINSVRQVTDKETSGKGVGYSSSELSRTGAVGVQDGETIVDTDKFEVSVSKGFAGKAEAEVGIDYKSAVTPDNPNLSAAANAAKRAREENLDLARSMRMHPLFKEKPDPLLPTQSKILRDKIEAVNKSLNTPLAGGAFKIGIIINGNRLDQGNAVKALENIQGWLDDIQSVLRLISDLSSAASGALLPFQIEVGLNYELTLLKGAIVGRMWSELQPPVTNNATYYFSQTRDRWQFRFDLTIVDGSFGVMVGGRLALLHKWIASIGVSVEFTIGGSVKVSFPMIQDGSADREVSLTARIPASLAAKADANAGPFYIEMKGDLSGGLVWQWIYAYQTVGGERELTCLKAGLKSDEISAKFVISRGNKLKARFYDDYEPVTSYQRPKNGRATWIPEGALDRDWVGKGK